MKKLIIVVSTLFALVWCSGCVQNQQVARSESQDEVVQAQVLFRDNARETEPPVFDLFCERLIGALSKLYYRYPDHREVRVHVKAVEGAIDKEPALNGYLGAMIAERFDSDAHCVKAYPADHAGLDCLLDAKLIDLRKLKGKKPFAVTANLIDARNGSIVFSEKMDFSFDDFDAGDYRGYAQRFVADRKQGSHLTVKAINIGSSYKAQDRYYLRTIYGGLRFRAIGLVKKDMGLSGYYPAEQSCLINGRRFTPDTDSCFFKGHMASGTIELIASFRTGFWDGYKGQQRLGEEHSKKFYVELGKDDSVNVDVIYVYQGKDPRIDVKAYRIKEIKSGGKVERVNEIINVLQ